MGGPNSLPYINQQDAMCECSLDWGYSSQALKDLPTLI